MFIDFLILMKFEWVIALIIFILLFIKLGKDISNNKLLNIIQVLLFLNLISGFIGGSEGNLFGTMFYTNNLIAFQKSLLNLGVFIISLICSKGLLKSEHLSEYFILTLSTLLGMFLMLSSNNLLMLYISLELATIPVAAMANYDLTKKRSSEAAMKMILSSAFSSGILLFGISLIYGVTGSIHFEHIAAAITNSPVAIMGFIFLFAAFAFKLSIVPFHLWTADVYEGAPIATTSFLSVISKSAIAFVVITLLYKVFPAIETVWYPLLVALAIASMLIGNLFALRQQNFKRFLAFSSIAQVGFILVGISAGDGQGITSVVYFSMIYIFSNLAAFGVISTVYEESGKETIESFKGLYKTNPLLTWVLAIALFSLAGIPPTAGFFGKLFLIQAGASKASYVFIIIASLNLIISLYYYLQIIKTMFENPIDALIAKIKLTFPAKIGFAICLFGIVFLGILGWVYNYIASLI